MTFFDFYLVLYLTVPYICSRIKIYIMPQESISIDRALKSDVMKYKTRGNTFSGLCKELIAEAVQLRKNPVDQIVFSFATTKLNQFLNDVLEESDFLGEKGQKVTSFSITRKEAEEYIKSVIGQQPEPIKLNNDVR